MDFCVEGEEDGAVLQEVEGMSSSKFCESMGFKVFEPPICYDGVPLAQTLSL